MKSPWSDGRLQEVSVDVLPGLEGTSEAWHVETKGGGAGRRAVIQNALITQMSRKCHVNNELSCVFDCTSMIFYVLLYVSRMYRWKFCIWRLLSLMKLWVDWKSWVAPTDLVPSMIGMVFSKDRPICWAGPISSYQQKRVSIVSIVSTSTK